MTNNQYRKALERLGLSHAKAARFFGFSRSSSVLYGTGRQPVPLVVAKLIRTMLGVGLSTQDVDQYHDEIRP